jgi:hypothetical protein
VFEVELPMPTLEPTEAAAPPRTICLMQAPRPGEVGVLRITKDRQTHYYVFKEIRCDIGGRGFAVHRLGLGNLYHVRVGRSRDCACECLGFLRHGRCKHVLGLSALIGHGLL